MSSTSLQRISTFVLFSFLLFQQVFAQTKTITGKVSDENGIPLADASVLIKSTKNGTVTAADGSFTIAVPANAKALTISHLGFGSQEITITKAVQLVVKLIAESSSLNDVVVVGYGTAKRKDVTGAITTVSAKDFVQGLVTSPTDQLQGKVAGLVITKADGDPNGSPIIRLRGQTSLLGSQSPLVVVDGVILDDAGQIANIPPGDIVSYDVLKDASATSIYGSRGANGVIIVNTKKGRAGKSQIDYNGFVSASTVAKKYKLLTTPEFFKALQDQGAAKPDEGDNNGRTTDWQDVLLRTGLTHSNTISMSGGKDNFTYSGSINYLKQNGIVINTGKEQLGLRFNAQQKAFDDKLVLSLGIVNSEVDRTLIDGSIFYNAYAMPPWLPEFKNGVDNPVFDYFYQNPKLLQNNKIKAAKEHLVQTYGTADYSLLKNLKLGTTGSITKFNTQSDFYLPVIPGQGNTNSGSKNNYNRNSQKGDLHINYSNDFGKSNINVLAAYEYNKYEYDQFSASAGNFVVDDFTNNALSLGDAASARVSSYKEEVKIISYLARATYNYDSKYYLTASVRRDGSSKFGKNHAYGTFPAVSAAWRINKEKFLENVSWIDELKVKAGYGITGNQDAIGAYSTYLTLTTNGYTYNPANGTYPAAYGPNQNPNKDLQWEQRVGKNLGVDFSFFKSRLTGAFNIFNDKTENMLFNYGVQVPPNFVPYVLANVGSLTNKGVEFQFGYDVIRRKDLTWNVGGNISTINTKVTSLSGSWDGNPVASDRIAVGYADGQGLSNNPITYLIVGKSPYTFVLPHYVGYDANGQSLFQKEGGAPQLGDQSNPPTNYEIDPSPKFNYGFSTSVTYKNWSANVFFRGVSGQKIFNNTMVNLGNFSRIAAQHNMLADAYYGPIKDIAPFPSDYFLEKASYMRLENLTVSYSLKGIKKLDNVRFYLTGNNLFVITKYKGIDPEIAPSSGANGGSGSAYLDVSYTSRGYYPKSRSITLGVSLSLK
ncbi:SusC/RagA family TonB-linked outer membrane protein [Ferruginibacter sp.]|uniref:SusC/RagA family TonB-linked outer membrane protein n=1 Tax=Ferruginibacter sp. TaxID=1940288 RepID=UPI0019B6F690|nr:SusC/RagA family TonB-linked outer membrane protein [Ferruginibacter sp.]MBC7628384.1 SusC/RagA family TonB-linked outer membrane protein [Ferruginibacter sp.]